MTAFRPKDLLDQATEAEKKGDKRLASAKFTMLSSHLQKKERWTEAKIVLDRAIRLVPRSARLYVQRALCEMKLGKELEARAAIDLFAHYAAEKKRTEEYSSYLDEHLNDYPDLRRGYYEGVLKLDRMHAFPFLGIAKCCLKKSQFSEARKYLLDGLSTKDRREEILENLAVAVASDSAATEHLNRFQKGEINQEELALLLEEKTEVRKEPKSRETSTSEAAREEEPVDLHTLIENLEEELGVNLNERHDEVAPLVKEFRDRSEPILKNDSQARIDLALAFFEMDLFKDAREELARVSRADRLFVEAQCLLAEILCAEDGWLAALDIYQECLRNPDLETSKKNHCLYKLVEVYLRLGDLEKAEREIRTLEKRDPNYRNLRFYKKEIVARERSRKAS